jgi:signal transduction histidine kinase
MNSETAIAREVDDILTAWRARVLHVLLVFSSSILLIPLLVVFFGWGVPLPWPLRVSSLLLYALLLLATLRPRWNLLVRVWFLLALIAAMGAIRLVAGQLEGTGRLTLLLPPLLALLLAGPRAGWAAVALSAALFALVPSLLHLGWFADWGMTGIDAPLSFWAMQGVFWLIILLTLMILFTRFQALQQRTMIAERMALRQLEVETADRRRLEEEIGRIGEEERRRLGAELHDGLCQHLTAALLHCSALESQRPAEGASLAAGLTRLRVSLEDAIGMAYDVAQGLCPLDMNPDALLPALERLCRDVRGRHGIACRVQADRALTIRNPEHALHLYRIAREAVVNAVKHARCTQLVIALEHAGADLVLKVTDDGRLTAPGAMPVPGLGLSIMTYRTGLLGGTLHVAGRAEGGIEVTCRVPRPEATP